MGRVRAPSTDESDDDGTKACPPQALAKLDLSDVHSCRDDIDDLCDATQLLLQLSASHEFNAFANARMNTTFNSVCTRLSTPSKERADDTIELDRLLGLCRAQTTAELARKDQSLRVKAQEELHEMAKARVAALAQAQRKVDSWKREMKVIAEAEEKAREKEKQELKQKEEAAQLKAKAEAKAKADAQAEKEIEEAEAKAKDEVKEEAITVQEPLPRKKSIVATPTPTREEPAKKEAHILASEQRLAKWLAIQAANQPILDSSDPNIKKIRMNVKKQIGEACNQVANTPASIQLVVKKLCSVLTDARNAGPEYLNFSLDILAARITSQVKVITEIRSCFPLAHVLTMCSIHSPELVDIFLAHLNKMCPYTIPYEPVKLPSESIEDYTKKIGMEWDEEDGKKKLETTEKYTMRMNIAVALQAAAMQTTPYDGSPQPKGLTIDDCWTWLANIANAKPHAFTASILTALLETAGFAMSLRYKRQFEKLLQLIRKDVLPHLSRDGKSGAAASLARLNTLLTENGVAKEPEGRLPQNSSVSEADEEKKEYENNSSGHQSTQYHGGGGRGRGRGRGGYR